jgi:hypothetical protein
LSATLQREQAYGHRFLGPKIGLVVLSFMLDDYWGHHYVDRLWYRERHRWEGRRCGRSLGMTLHRREDGNAFRLLPKAEEAPVTIH